MTTLQNIYDRVRLHMLKQGRRAMLPSGACAYRTEGGHKCAVGCLIADEHYSTTFECVSLESLTNDIATAEKKESALQIIGAVAKSLGLPPFDVESDTFKLLHALQEVHDDINIVVDKWPVKLAAVAKRFGLRPITNQEIFDTVRDHLRTQNCKATNDHEVSCRYLGDGGKRCAVGVLIKPELYREVFEGMSINASFMAAANELRAAVAQSLGMESLPEDTLQLLAELQAVHDHRSVEEWPTELADVAVRHGLTP